MGRAPLAFKWLLGHRQSQKLPAGRHPCLQRATPLAPTGAVRSGALLFAPAAPLPVRSADLQATTPLSGPSILRAPAPPSPHGTPRRKHLPRATPSPSTAPPSSPAAIMTAPTSAWASSPETPRIRPTALSARLAPSTRATWDHRPHRSRPPFLGGGRERVCVRYERLRAGHRHRRPTRWSARGAGLRGQPRGMRRHRQQLRRLGGQQQSGRRGGVYG
jgi:hypothetical protein